jgi:hypothetical protein
LLIVPTLLPEVFINEVDHPPHLILEILAGFKDGPKVRVHEKIDKGKGSRPSCPPRPSLPLAQGSLDVI